MVDSTLSRASNIEQNFRMPHDRTVPVFPSQLTIKEIAFQVGFRNPSYFTRIFKEISTMSPREYRLYMR